MGDKSHAVIDSLRDPLAALKEMCRVVKPGGLVRVRDADRAGELRRRHDPAVERLHDFWSRLGLHNGGDPFIGRRLRALFSAAGLLDVVATASDGLKP